MTNCQYLSPLFAVAGALAVADMAVAKAIGFATVINFRPDNEAPGQEATCELEAAAHAAGLGYFHIPARKHDLFADAVVSETASVLAAVSGPTLGTCASGQRAAVLWAAAAARTQPVETVIAALGRAGLDHLAFLRDDLEAQADRARWNDAVATPTRDAGRCVGAELSAA